MIVRGRASERARQWMERECVWDIKIEREWVSVCVWESERHNRETGKEREREIDGQYVFERKWERQCAFKTEGERGERVKERQCVW